MIRASICAALLSAFVCAPQLTLADGSDAETDNNNLADKRGEHCRINVAGPLYLHDSDLSNCVITVQGEGSNGSLFVLTNGYVDASNSTFFATEKVVFLNQGGLNLLTSDIGGGMVVFAQKGPVQGAGANFTAETVCGNLVSSDVSGASFIAEKQISLDLSRAQTGSNLFRTDIFGPGALPPGGLGLSNELDCRINLTDMNRLPLGHCPRGTGEDPVVQCDW